MSSYTYDDDYSAEENTARALCAISQSLGYLTSDLGPIVDAAMIIKNALTDGMVSVAGIEGLKQELECISQNTADASLSLDGVESAVNAMADKAEEDA